MRWCSSGPASRSASAELEPPEPGDGEVLVEVEACGVCRTDLHVVDGELTEPKLPLVPGHQVVGRVVASGAGVGTEEGSRVGVPWLAWTCGVCERCREGRENLCPRALFTGYTADGGYAERLSVDARYALPLDDAVDAVAAAPLLCAGLIGYRALRMCGDAARVGLYGFGSSAHLICQLLAHEGRERVRVHPRRGRGGPGLRARPRCGVGRRFVGGASGAARRGGRLRPDRRARPGRAASRAGGRLGRLRGDPHVRHPVLPLRAALG